MLQRVLRQPPLPIELRGSRSQGWVGATPPFPVGTNVPVVITLEIYERPYNAQEPVVCLDEKPVVLHGEVRAGKQARPGTLAKRDYEYKKQGGASVFCAVEAKAGRHFTHPTPGVSGRSPLTPKEGVNGPPDARCPP